ncbi:MAG: hypothetical protein O3A84_15170 [Proteobacteria bacterium]|nr:hypothetical protein [Pseudomonadota bacterium]
MTKLCQMNAADTATTIRDGKVSARDVVEAHLARIDAIKANGMQTAVNYLNLPAVDGPHGRSPMGIQIIGRRFREDMCLDAAEVIQNATSVVAKELWVG